MAYISTGRVKEIRDSLKKAFPDFKMSVTREHSTSVHVCLIEGPIDFGRTAGMVNQYWYKDHYAENAPALAVLEKLMGIVGEGSYDRNAGDVSADYCDFNFYFSVYLGKWNRELGKHVPYVCIKKGE